MELVMDICDAILVLNLGSKLAEGTPRRSRPTRLSSLHTWERGRHAVEMLKVKNINTYYGKVHALKNISLHLKPGRDRHPDRRQRCGQDHDAEHPVRNYASRSGEILLEGASITSLSADRIVTWVFPRCPKGARCSIPLRRGKPGTGRIPAVPEQRGQGSDKG